MEVEVNAQVVVFTFNIVWCGIYFDYNQILKCVPVSKCVSDDAPN
jgi:hypothetical protein